MYGKISALPTTSGVALLPFAADNRVLFIVALGLVVTGVAIFTVSTLAARKSRKAVN
jgi:hypothetical protein